MMERIENAGGRNSPIPHSITQSKFKECGKHSPMEIEDVGINLSQACSLHGQEFLRGRGAVILG